MSSPQFEIKQNVKGKKVGGLPVAESRKRKWIFPLERERLLSKNTGDPTIGSLRDKKENFSTRRGLHVGTGFRKFLQTP